MSLWLAKVALGAALATLALAAPAGAARYYLSLGDSLAQGMQPGPGGLTVNTDHGYADQLYASEKTRIAGLKLVKLGCGGETTTSFLTGHGNSADALLLGCHPAGGSQMNAAERFLRSHRREVAFVTLDIGANDIDGCAPEGSLEVSCVTKGVERIAANLPAILRRLRQAAAPGTPMAAMTLYDPFLALYLKPGEREEALATVQYAQNINRGLTRLYAAANFSVAAVDMAFKTYDLAANTKLPGESAPVPVAVAEVCKLTWMCAPSPLGPNIHANQSGYGVIARAFASALAKRR